MSVCRPCLAGYTPLQVRVFQGPERHKQASAAYLEVRTLRGVCIWMPALTVAIVSGDQNAPLARQHGSVVVPTSHGCAGHAHATLPEGARLQHRQRSASHTGLWLDSTAAAWSLEAAAVQGMPLKVPVCSMHTLSQRPRADFGSSRSEGAPGRVLTAGCAY